MSNNPDSDQTKNRLSLSPSPSRDSNSSNLDDDLDFSSPNSSFGKNDQKDSGEGSLTASTQKSSKESSPEKKSSDREKSTDSHDSEITPDDGKSQTKKTVSSPPPSPDEPQGSPSPSTSSTQAQSNSPSTSASNSDKKRKSTLSDEELKQAIKRFKKQDEERMRMQVLVSNFSEEQLNRYEMFRRATFPRAAIKRLMQNITGTTVSQNVVIAMSGISKVFVGEVLETALDVSEKWEDSGALQPKHLREAVRILNAKGMMPTTKSKKSLF